MADSKISALAAITSLAAADQLAVAHSAASKSIRADHMSGFELDYVETTANTTITSTTDGASGGTALIDGNSVTYDGSTRICIEVFCPLLYVAVASASQGVYINLYDGTTDLGRLGELRGDVAGQSQTQLMLARRFLTPSNAAHTYHIRGWKDAAGSTAAFVCGAGGSATLMPGYYRITVA